MSTWNFGTAASTTTPGTAFGGFGSLGTSSAGTTAAPAAGGTSFFGGLGSSTPAAKPTGFTGFGLPTTTAAAAPTFSFPTATTTAPTTGLGASTLFGTTTANTTYAFPTKSAEKPDAAGSSTTTPSSSSNKAGSTGKKPKDNVIQEHLVPDICELEKKIQEYQKIQTDAEEYTLQDAVEWDAEIKQFDLAATRVKNQLTDTFTRIDVLRKNTARLRSHNLLSSRLSSNPAMYYSVASSVEAYFMEVVSGLRTEMEIFEEELQHLEDLHSDLIRPGDRFNPLDLQETYMYLSKIVNGVAVAVEEVAKVGDELRREIQANKGTAAPIPAPQQPFLGQDVVQLSSARSLFSASPLGSATSVFGNQSTPSSKSPLLQPMNPEIQSAMFNPAMRSLNRMDSSSMNAGTPTSPQISRRQQTGYFLSAGSPGF